MSFDPAHLLQQLTQMPTAKRYLVAFSGGCDSHVLLHSLAQLRPQLDIPVHAIHINHGLSSQADEWSHHCQRVCEELEVPYTAISVDASSVDGASPEEAARKARYMALAETMQEGDGLILAHHQDDQAETLMLQLIRGSGAKGLAAMPSSVAFASGWLGRPLLVFSRNSLCRYAQQQDLKWVEDPSNFDTDFDRNFLREKVMPLLKTRWPSLDLTLSRAASHQAEASDLLAELARQDRLQAQADEHANQLEISALQNLPVARQRNLLRYWISDVRGLAVPDSRHLARVLDELIPAAKDAVPLVAWPGCELRRFNGLLYAMPPLTEHTASLSYVWDLQQTLCLETVSAELRVKPQIARGLKADLAGRGNIRVGFRQGGEVCRPAGRGHRHQLKKLMQEWRIPPWLRDRIALVYVGNDIAAVVGYCVCEPYQASDKEKGILVSQIDT